MSSPIQPEQSQTVDTTVAPNPTDTNAQQPYAKTRAALLANPHLFDELLTPQANPPEDGEDRPQPGKVSQFLHTLWDTAKSIGHLAGASYDARARVMGATGDPEARSASQALVRGSVKAVTQTAETALQVEIG